MGSSAIWAQTAAPEPAASAPTPTASTAAPATPTATPTAAPTATPPAASTGTTLPTVIIRGQRDREATGYSPGVSQVGKTPQALKDIPNSVTVVPEQLMHDRQADTFKEALRNVAGLTFNAGEGGRAGDNITLRGFSVVGDLYLDNIRDIAQYNRETFNLESIDVLRGSASMLYGRGSAGGIINQVSKTPHRFDGKEVSLTLGNHGYKRATADLTHALSETTVARLNLMATDTDSFRDEVFQKRWGVAPSVVFGLGTPQQLTLSYYYLNEDNLPDYGVPYLNGLPLAVPVNTFYGLANADYEKNSAGIGTISYQHKLAPDSSIKTVLRRGQYQRDLWVTAPRLANGTTVLDANTLVNRGRPARGGEEDATTSQTDWTFKAQTGAVKHDVLLGLELAQEKSVRWSNANGTVNPPTTGNNSSQIQAPPANAFAPNAFPALPAGYLSTRFRHSYNFYTARTVGVYAQDTVQLAPQWQLVAGLRYDRFKSDYERTAPLGPLTRKDSVWSKKLGGIYQPDDSSSYYLSWGTSFNPSGELYQLDDRSQNTPPETNRNIELGAKWDVMNGDLALRTAIYRTEKTNERNTDVNNASVFLLSGKRRTKGIEFEAAGRISKAWEVFASAAFQSGEITEASGQQANTQGKTPINTPEHTASLWSTYRLTSQWKIGAGIERVARRWGNATNTNALPGYERVDAMVEYKLDQWAAQLNIKNLLDKDYYEGVYSGHTVPGAKRSVQLSVAYKF
jgi:catecholate siderophore receptor